MNFRSDTCSHSSCPPAWELTQASPCSPHQAAGFVFRFKTWIMCLNTRRDTSVNSLVTQALVCGAPGVTTAQLGQRTLQCNHSTFINRQVGAGEGEAQRELPEVAAASRDSCMQSAPV